MVTSACTASCSPSAGDGWPRRCRCSVLIGTAEAVRRISSMEEGSFTAATSRRRRIVERGLVTVRTGQFDARAGRAARGAPFADRSAARLPIVQRRRPVDNVAFYCSVLERDVARRCRLTGRGLPSGSSKSLPARLSRSASSLKVIITCARQAAGACAGMQIVSLLDNIDLQRHSRAGELWLARFVQEIAVHQQRAKTNAKPMSFRMFIARATVAVIPRCHTEFAATPETSGARRCP